MTGVVDVTATSVGYVTSFTLLFCSPVLLKRGSGSTGRNQGATKGTGWSVPWPRTSEVYMLVTAAESVDCHVITPTTDILGRRTEGC